MVLTLFSQSILTLAHCWNSFTNLHASMARCSTRTYRLTLTCSPVVGVLGKMYRLHLSSLKCKYISQARFCGFPSKHSHFFFKILAMDTQRRAFKCSLQLFWKKWHEIDFSWVPIMMLHNFLSGSLCCLSFSLVASYKKYKSLFPDSITIAGGQITEFLFKYLKGSVWIASINSQLNFMKL